MDLPLAARALLVAGLALLPLAGLQDPENHRPAPGPAPVASDAAALKKMAWICGTWVLQNGKMTIEEHWRPLQGGTILGSSHAYGVDRTIAFEFLRITLVGDQLAYVAQPSGLPPTTFLAAKLEDSVVEFENAKHDHPQRIRYEKTAAGITATICQLDGSRAQSFVFKKKD